MIISQDDIVRLSDTDSCTMHCNKHIIFRLIAFWDNFIEVNALILVPSCYKKSLSTIPELHVNEHDVVGHYSCGQSGSYTICTHIPYVQQKGHA